MKNIIFMVLIVLIFSGCSSVTKIQESFRDADYDYSLMRNSSIGFAGTNKIFLKQFINTYKDEYSDTIKLNNKIYDLFSREFKKQIPAVKFSRLGKNIPKMLQGELSLKENNNESADSFFTGLNADYLLFIKSIEIGNSYTPPQYYNANNNSWVSGSSEDCVVSIEIVCWDVRGQTRILQFRGFGNCNVVLASYLSSLNNAIEQAVINSVEFIKDRRI